MSNVEGVRAALLEFMLNVPLDAKVALMLTGGELAILHLALEIQQAIIEKHSSDPVPFGEFGSLRKKVEDVLSQAGYGGDTRPG